MLDKYADDIANIVGYIGRILVFISLVCGCILIWTIIIKSILR